MRGSLTSQPLKGEQVGSCCLSSFGLLRALRLLLFFSLSVLGPGGSQDPGRFCLRAGPFLFIRRESTSYICMGSYCLALERWGRCRGNAGRRSVSRQIAKYRPKAVKLPATACLERCGFRGTRALGGQADGGPQPVFLCLPQTRGSSEQLLVT